MSGIIVEELNRKTIEEQRTEIVERKGLGHPDSICDAIMNEISLSLSKEYLNKFGAIMHHNVDKGMLIAGETNVNFGGGKILKPILIVFGDRATFKVGDETIPIEEMAISTTKDWIKRNLRYVDPSEHVNYQVELKRGSEALADIFKRGGKFLGANDTSAAVGFAPLTKVESIVLETERFLNGSDFNKQFPESGEDIKVMGSRKDNELTLTIGMAIVDRFINNEKDYFTKKDEILEEIKNFVSSRIDDKTEIFLNTADKEGRGTAGLFLTVLGTSADGGDCGQVGRGNRVNGIIPLNRPTCSEAAAGKNPVNHVGKIYNLLTYRIANKIYEGISGVRESYVWLLSQIGKPINEPEMASTQLVLEEGVKMSDISSQVEDIVLNELANIDKFSSELIEGKVPVC
ncbi:MAG: methionine adenosyltransferase [Candidatus Bathyarchaeota archaeon]|nr:methionine adenosyltransferase [Candidatus Bathyarchaeota archaeon]